MVFRYNKINFSTASLEGTGAENFKIIDNNTIVLKERVTQGDEYNLTLVITDSEAQESRNPLYIRVGSIHSVIPLFKASKTLKTRKTLKSTKTVDRRESEQERVIYEIKRREEQERIRREEEM